MEDRDFFDHLYQIWSKTTGASDRYWMPEEYTDRSGRWRIYAVAEDESRKLIASDVSDVDADFITAVHGCVSDLIRRLGDAIDESDRLDAEKDELVCRVAELEMEVDRKQSFINDLENPLTEEAEARRAAEVEISNLKDQLETARTDAGFYQQQWMEGR